MPRSRKLILGIGIPAAILVLIQLVPYGRAHTNPPVEREPAWDSPRTRELAKRACFDCHSNETRWPWYSSIAPLSWRVQAHVDEGREKLNFSAFDAGSRRMAHSAGEAGEVVTEGEMPLKDYVMMHPEARLSLVERRDLAAGLDATFAVFVEAERKRREERRRNGE